MSKASLKKVIKDLEKDSLAQIILELYDARPEAKEYLEFWLNPDADAELQKYRKRIYKIFFISEVKPRKSPAFTEIKNHLKYFISLGIEPEKVADLMLYISETYRDWLSLRRHVVSHKNRFDKFLTDTSSYIETAALEELYGLRLSRVREEAEKIFERGDDLRRRRWGWRW